MKARRAAEAQRKALEEKLQLEWAWKPMAAVMNEKKTDLVYWIPPLYRNNIKIAGSRVRRKSLASRSSQRSSLSHARLPYAHMQAAQMYTQLQATQKKKKLGHRRAKLHAEVSFEDPTDVDSAALGSMRLSRRRSKLGKKISFEDQTDLESTARESMRLTRRRTRLNKKINIDDHSDADSTAIQSIRISRRRSRLNKKISIEDPTDADSAILDSMSEWQDEKDEDNESGIHDETPDFYVDDLSLTRVPSIREEPINPAGGTVRRRLGEHRRVTQTSIKPKVPPKPDFITKSFEAIDKPKPAPTLLRLLEKVSHIHSPPVRPIKPIKPDLKKIGRSDSKDSKGRKIKRPSVKIYRNPSTRLSGKRAKAALEEQAAIENQCVIVSVDHMPQETPKPPKGSKSSKAAKPPKVPKSPKPPKASKGSLKKSKPSIIPPKAQQEHPVDPIKELLFPKEGPSKIDDAAFRNAQLQMILRLLAQLYEEKVSRQDTEIQNMKMRIQTQDKLMKQMAHVVLELKEEVYKVKTQVSAPPHSDNPSNVLNIKVGGDN